MNVIFIKPTDVVHTTDDAVVYVGDLMQRLLFTDDSPVRYFASFTALTSTLAPLLLLAETRTIRVQTSLNGKPILITADAMISDIEERIDDILHTTIPDGCCIYRALLGPDVSISAHICSDHT